MASPSPVAQAAVELSPVFRKALEVQAWPQCDAGHQDTEQVQTCER
jgi:hypothetical protein